MNLPCFRPDFTLISPGDVSTLISPCSAGSFTGPDSTTETHAQKQINMKSEIITSPERANLQPLPKSESRVTPDFARQRLHPDFARICPAFARFSVSVTNRASIT